jgi:hypothetical protein
LLIAAKVTGANLCSFGDLPYPAPPDPPPDPPTDETVSLRIRFANSGFSSFGNFNLYLNGEYLGYYPGYDSGGVPEDYFVNVLPGPQYLTTEFVSGINDPRFDVTVTRQDTMTIIDDELDAGPNFAFNV